MADEAELTREASLRLGTLLRGKYRLDRVIGVGGMAAVYAATHRNSKPFAIKMLDAHLSRNTEVRTRFLREGYVANSVKHPGAVAVIDDDVTDDGVAFLVMELLEGSTVEALRDASGGTLGAVVVLAIAEQLLSVLAAAHANGIVHRDIKPANLFVTRSGELKVLDFGIARLRDAAGAGTGTQTGLMLGTPAFMSPEQAQAKSSAIDAQSDVWAVGATLFTLLSGRLVHQAESAHATLFRAGTTPAEPLLTVAPSIDPELAALVDRALAFDKKQRWDSAEAMRVEVERLYAASSGGRASSIVLAAALDPSAEVAQRPRAPSASTPETHFGLPEFALSQAKAPPATAPMTAPTAPRNVAAPAVTAPAASSVETAEPVASEQMGRPLAAPSKRRWIAVVAGGIVLIGGTWAVQFFAHSAEGSHAAALPPPAAAASADASPSPAAEASTAPLAQAPPPPPPATVAIPPPGPSVTHHAEAKPRPTLATPTAPSKVDCVHDPFVVIDGIKRVKEQCR